MDQDPPSPHGADDLPPDEPTTASDPVAASDPLADERPAWMTGGPPDAPGTGTPLSPPTAPAYTLPTIDPSPSSPPKDSGRQKGIAAVGVALAVFAGAFALKFVIGFLVAGAASSVIGAAFGGPWDRLPAETRDQLNQRAEAALGDAASGLSTSEKSDKLVDMGDRGLTRLDDATLIRRIELYQIGLDAVDEATCAAIMRSSMTGPVTGDDALALVGALSTERFAEWAEIWVQALEAEASGAPPVRTLSDADSTAMFDAIFAGISDAEFSTIQALSDGTTVTDTEACDANRAIYAAGLGLDDVNRAAFALTDVAP